MTERYPGARDPRRTGQARLPLYAAPLHVVLDRLVSSEQGLPEDEAARRLEMLGPNRLSAARLKPVSAILAGQLRSVVVLLLLTAVALALITGRTLEAAVVGLVLVVNVLLGLRAELKGRRFIDILLRNRQEEAVVLRDGGSVRIDASRLVPGDVIDVVAGQRVPADARLIRATGVRAEEEFLTGSAKPVEKAVDPPPSAGTPLQGRRSMLFFGSTLSQGRARAVVTATGTSTAASRLGRASRALERRMTPLESRIEGVGRRMGWMALGWAGVVLVVGLIRDQELTRLLEAGIALCLAAVPEALPIVTALALTIAIHRMARRRVVVRRSGAIEGLGTATVVCADVVGTLTSGPPRATRIVTPSAVATAVESGTEERPELEMVPAAPEAKAEVDGLLRAVALTLERAPGTDGTDRDLTNRALWDLVRIAGMDPWHLLRSAPVVAVVPPDPDHPMSATFRRGETGSSAFVRGDVDAVLARCRSTSGPRGPRNLDAEGRSRILADSRTLAAEGYRVIAFALHPNAARTADLRDPLTYLGMIGLENAPATDVATTFADLEKAGVTTVLFTDDEGITGQAVARRAGVAVKDHEVLEVTEATGPEPFRMNGAGPARR
ncbi:MAG: cation-transporting P-type ATPase, partial [Gemmatimonadota bacterium]